MIKLNKVLDEIEKKIHISKRFKVNRAQRSLSWLFIEENCCMILNYYHEFLQM